MREITALSEIADNFDAIVLDQYGVLHDGTRPYPGAIETLSRLKAAGHRLAVLSNSGKRSAPNAARIARMGYDEGLFDIVMSSGEALWQDVAAGRITARRFFPVAAHLQDAEAWAQGLDVEIVASFRDADALLIMGYPDPLPNGFEECLFKRTSESNLPVYCTNPDRASPRGDQVVRSCGALAHRMAEAGQDVRFYGKPHRPIFQALERHLGLPPERLLMVGDSLEHDIAGAAGVGWASLFVRGGLHAGAFSAAKSTEETIAALAAADAAPMPTFTVQTLGA